MKLTIEVEIDYDPKMGYDSDGSTPQDICKLFCEFLINEFAPYKPINALSFIPKSLQYENGRRTTVIKDICDCDI